MSHSPLIIDIAGLSLSVADRRRLEQPLTGGVILLHAIGRTASN